MGPGPPSSSPLISSCLPGLICTRSHILRNWGLGPSTRKGGGGRQNSGRHRLIPPDSFSLGFQPTGQVSCDAPRIWCQFPFLAGPPCCPFPVLREMVRFPRCQREVPRGRRKGALPGQAWDQAAPVMVRDGPCFSAGAAHVPWDSLSLLITCLPHKCTAPRWQRPATARLHRQHARHSTRCPSTTTPQSVSCSQVPGRAPGQSRQWRGVGGRRPGLICKRTPTCDGPGRCPSATP